MPSEVIVDQSLLLTRAGWSRANECSPTSRIVGVDRYGQFVEQNVSLQDIDGAETVAFVGLTGGLALLSERTRVIEISERRLNIGDLMQGTEIQNRRFEWPDGAGALVDSNHYTRALLQDLEEVATFVKSDKILIRCGSKTAEPVNPRYQGGDHRTITQFGHRQYICLSKNKLADEWNEYSPDVIDFLVEHWRTDEEGRLEFPRLGYRFLMSIVLLGWQRGQRMQAVYDGLQHTCVLYITPDRASSTLMQSCKCTFIMPYKRQGINIAWENSGWAPLSGSVLLAGGVGDA